MSGAGRVSALLGVVCLALPAPACADPETPSAWWDEDRLLGDPGGARSRLERLGVQLQLFYNQYLSGKPPGGGARSHGAFGTSGSYDFLARVDLESATGWPGADGLLHLKGQYQSNINEDVGALSDPVDDADFDEPVYVDELWLQQSLFDRRLRVRAGFGEQQTVFDRNAYANNEDRQFLMSYLDNSGVVPLPNALGVMLLVAPWPWLELTLGVADADNEPLSAGFDTFFDGADSLIGYLEVLVRSPLESSGLPGAWRLGVFRDGRELGSFETGRRDRGHFGFYASFDQQLWCDRRDASRRLGLFARAGHADPEVNRVAWFWSLGFEAAGPIPGRNRDVLGFGVYQTIASDSYRDEVDPGFDRETGLELYYAVQVLGWLVITPDLQYLVDPGATGRNDDAFVGSLRLRVSF